MSPNSIDCTVIGDVFMDIVTFVQNGASNPITGGTSYCKFAKAALGGSGNVASTLTLLGGNVAFVGKAGKDYFGNLYQQDLKKAKIKAKIFFDEYSPTGLIIVFVKAKERSFIIFRGANDKLTEEEIENAKGLIKRSKYMYFSGFSLVRNPQKNAILRAVDLARQYETKIVFDPGAYNLINSHPKLFVNLLEACDVFAPNLEEARAIAKTKDLAGIISILKNKAPMTALKCGQHGAILLRGKEIVRIPPVRVNCVDPTGSGDAFVGALIYGLVQELPLEIIGRIANWLGAQVSTKTGGRGFPTKPEIDHFLNKNIKIIRS